MISGLDFGSGVKIQTPATNNFNNGEDRKNTKYLNINVPGEYVIRLVSGYVPFHAHFITGKGYRICPKTVLMTYKGIDPIHQTEFCDRVYKKISENYKNYTEEEAYCPICSNNTAENKSSLLTRYAVNVIDRSEQRINPNSVPVKILASTFDVFKYFMMFTDADRPYSPQDVNLGWDFKIITMKDPGAKNNKCSYTVSAIKQTPLSEYEKNIVKNLRSKENQNGVWDLIQEYNPFTCSPKMSVFDKSLNQEQSINVPSPAPMPVPQQQYGFSNANPQAPIYQTGQQIPSQGMVNPSPYPTAPMGQPQGQYSPMQAVQTQITPIDNSDPADAIQRLMQGL